MILDALHRLTNPALSNERSLSRAEARDVMGDVLAGKCTDAQIAALLIALRMKGETVEEIVDSPKPSAPPRRPYRSSAPRKLSA